MGGKNEKLCNCIPKYLVLMLQEDAWYSLHDLLRWKGAEEGSSDPQRNLCKEFQANLA